MKRNEFIRTSIMASLGLMLGGTVLNACKKDTNEKEFANPETGQKLQEGFNYLIVRDIISVSDDKLKAKFNCDSVISCTLVKSVKLKNRRAEKIKNIDAVYTRLDRKGKASMRGLVTFAEESLEVKDYIGKDAVIKLPMINGQIAPALKSKLLHQDDLISKFPKQSIKNFNKLMIS
ncbi:hypothetical protein SAMN04488511_102333 [Pedobacter suwonensis]|uniref:Uncharacterized protein n=1 Tax=Pedobacter suwonensis TaxID=332999 RepID=A0A1I0SPQ0_9SPHI|nr:hypothetical protein [Pedobacter suwonensis]SFA41494.1 hypothetical protein SAMN04488511_102333 [Pedobacter suwonensis]